MELEERLRTLEEMRKVFSAQAKVAEGESKNVNKIGIALQVLSTINFNETYKVVLNNDDSEVIGEE